MLEQNNAFFTPCDSMNVPCGHEQNARVHDFASLTSLQVS